MSIDLKFRPASYSDFSDPVAVTLNGINGQMRREMVRDMLTAEGEQRTEYDELLGTIEPDILEERADPSFISNLSSLGGPTWMGGEYLPRTRRNEVEIARVVLQSVTMDVFSLRARWSGGRYHYRVVDEYASAFELPRRTSRRTLTLDQVIEILEMGYSPEWTSHESGLVQLWWEQQRENGYDLDKCVAFAWIESEIYPELPAWYEERASAWKAGHRDKVHDPWEDVIRLPDLPDWYKELAGDDEPPDEE